MTAAALAVVVAGATLPATPLADVLGLTRLPVSYFGFLLVATLMYLLLVDVAKRQLVRRARL